MEEHEELEQLRQSLGMIKNILGAKNESGRQSRVEHAARIREFIRDFTANLYETCLSRINREKEISSSDSKKKQLRIDIVKSQKKLQEETDNWFVSEQKNWLKNKTAVAFIGGFSSGKTTIVNRMLGEEHKLPVDRRATTAVPTYVSYSTIGMVKFADFDYNVKYLDDSDILTKFTKFNDALKDFPISRLVRNFIVADDNPTLRTLKDIIILDTPGFENDDEDTKRVMEVIKETDALFWVIDINKGDINNYSLQVIKEHIREIPLYIVINKIDLKSDNERTAVTKKIHDTLKKNSVDVKGYIQFSKKTDIKDITSVMQRIKHKGRRDVLTSIETVFNEIITTMDEYVDSYNKKLRENKREIRDIEDEINEKNTIMKQVTESLNNATSEIADCVRSLCISPMEFAFRVARNNYYTRNNYRNGYEMIRDIFKKSKGYEHERLNIVCATAQLDIKRMTLDNSKKEIEKQLNEIESLANLCKERLTEFKKLTESFTDLN
jgi:GTPase Era involved in 16S rRNA processing